MSNTRKSIFIILLILLADQTLKVVVKTQMTLYEQIPVFGQWGILHFVENNGMAFGLALPGSLGKILLTSFRIVAVVGIGIYLRLLIRLKAHTGLIITLSMVMAGALGNIIDSVFYGLVFSEPNPKNKESDGKYADKTQPIHQLQGQHPRGDGILSCGIWRHTDHEHLQGISSFPKH